MSVWFGIFVILGLIISFIGAYALIHKCSKSNCCFFYQSTKRKIEIYPKDKPQSNNLKQLDDRDTK